MPQDYYWFGIPGENALRSFARLVLVHDLECVEHQVPEGSAHASFTVFNQPVRYVFPMRSLFLWRTISLCAAINCSRRTAPASGSTLSV